MINRWISRALKGVLLMMTLLSVIKCKTPSETTTGPETVKPPAEEEPAYFHEPLQGSDSLRCEGRILPLKFRMMKADYPGLRKKLLSVSFPAKDAQPDTLLLTVPSPDGDFSVFRIFPSSVMPPELAARYPEIRTFAGSGVLNPSDQIRLEITPLGFTSMVISENGSMIISPFCQSDSVHVIVYFKKDLPPGAKVPFEK